MEMETTTVTLVRHGESEWNKMNLFCGWVDVNLSEEGEWDALAVSAESLKKINAKFNITFTSALKRSLCSANIILNSLNCSRIPIISSWRLNERHYGALTGFNKRQMANMYGEEQVQIWRRSFDVSPPTMTPLNPYYESIHCNPKFKGIPENEFPDTESLATTMERVIPFWDSSVVPEIKKGSRILVVAHGTSLRGIVKHIEGMKIEEIVKFNLPNSIPFTYTFDVRTATPLGRLQFLADEKTVSKAVEKVASIGI